MRIIQFIDSLGSGGAERMAVNISNVLEEDGHEVVLVVSRYLGDLKDFVSAGVRIVYLKKRIFVDIIAFIKLIKVIIDFKPDVIHAHSSSVYWAVLAKLFIGNKFQIVFHDHNGYSEQLKPNDRRALRWMSFGIDKVIAVNDILKEWSILNLRVHNSKIVVIRNFPYLDIQPNEKSNKIFTILCLANLRIQKDHFTLLKAFSLVKKKLNLKSLNLVLAGNGTGDTYQQQVEAIIKENALEDSVSLKGAVHHVEGMLAEANIGILSSISEGLPVSLLEYGLAALPVVVTNVGQCAEVVGYGKFGKVVSPSDPEAMAKAIEDLLLDPEAATKMGAAFKNHIAENYGPKRFLMEYYQLLDA